MILLGIVVYHVDIIVLEEARATMEDQMKLRKREKESSKRYHGNQNSEDGRRNQYDKMRNVEQSTRLQGQTVIFTISLTTWLFLWLAGAFIFHLCER